MMLTVDLLISGLIISLFGIQPTFSQLYNDEYRYTPFRYIFVGDQSWSIISMKTFCFHTYQYGFNHNLTSFHLKDHRSGCSDKERYFNQLMPATNTIKDRWHGITHFDKVLYFLRKPGEPANTGEVFIQKIKLSFAELGYTEKEITYEDDQSTFYTSIMAYYFMLAWISLHNQDSSTLTNRLYSFPEYENNQHILRGVAVIDKHFEEAFYVSDSYGQDCTGGGAVSDIYISELKYFTTDLLVCYRKKKMNTPKNWHDCFNNLLIGDEEPDEKVKKCLLMNSNKDLINSANFPIIWPHSENCTIVLIFENNGHEAASFKEKSTGEIFDFLLNCIRKHSYYHYIFVERCKTWINLFILTSEIERYIGNVSNIVVGHCLFYTEAQHDFTLPLSVSKLDLKELAGEYLKRSIIKPYLFTAYIVSLILVVPAVVALMVRDFVRRTKRLEKERRLSRSRSKRRRRKRKHSKRKKQRSRSGEDDSTTFTSDSESQSNLSSTYNPPPVEPRKPTYVPPVQSTPRPKSAPPRYTQAKASPIEPYNDEPPVCDHAKKKSYHPRPGAVSEPSLDEQRRQMNPRISDDNDDSDDTAAKPKKSRYIHRATDYQIMDEETRYRLKKESEFKDAQGNTRTTYRRMTAAPDDEFNDGTRMRTFTTAPNYRRSERPSTHKSFLRQSTKPRSLIPGHSKMVRHGSEFGKAKETPSVHKTRQSKRD